MVQEVLEGVDQVDVDDEAGVQDQMEGQEEHQVSVEIQVAEVGVAPFLPEHASAVFQR